MAVAACMDAVGADMTRMEHDVDFGKPRLEQTRQERSTTWISGSRGWSARGYRWVHGEQRGCEVYEALGLVASSTVMEAWWRRHGEGGRGEAAWGGRLETKMVCAQREAGQRSA
jgi:hypothetical protein